MGMVTDAERQATAGPPLPSALVLGWRRGGLEIKQFFRDKDAVIFAFSFPVLLLAIFGSIFSGDIDGTDVDFRQVFAAGMIASGIMSVSLVSLAIGIAAERDDGTLKRLRGSPMPKAAYFLGKILSVLVTAAAEVAVLIVVGTALFGLEPPTEVGRWVTFGWVFVLGLTGCTLLGIAISGLPQSGRSAPAVVNPPILLLQFISGVFILYSELPGYLQTIGAFFPLKWMCQGLRSVFLPDSWLAAGQEPAGSWEHGRTALVLIVWCVGGLVLVLYTFRWKGRRDG